MFKNVEEFNMFKGRAPIDNRTRACQVMERGYHLLARSVVDTMPLNSKLHGTPWDSPKVLFCLLHVLDLETYVILKCLETCHDVRIRRIPLRASLSVSTVLSLVLLAVLRPLSQVKGLACARDIKQWKQVIESVIHIFRPDALFAFSYYAHVFHVEYGLRFRWKKS